MDEYIVQGSVGMERGCSLRIDDGRGMLICVSEGEVWLTQHGSQKDHVLDPGECFRLDRDGAAIAYSFRRSVLTLSAPQPELYARRIALTPAGTGTPVELYDAHNRISAGKRFVHSLRRFWSRLSAILWRPATAWG